MDLWTCSEHTTGTRTLSSVTWSPKPLLNFSDTEERYMLFCWVCSALYSCFAHHQVIDRNVFSQRRVWTREYLTECCRTHLLTWRTCLTCCTSLKRSRTSRTHAHLASTMQPYSSTTSAFDINQTCTFSWRHHVFVFVILMPGKRWDFTSRDVRRNCMPMWISFLGTLFWETWVSRYPLERRTHLSVTAVTVKARSWGFSSASMTSQAAASESTVKIYRR